MKKRFTRNIHSQGRLVHAAGALVALAGVVFGFAAGAWHVGQAAGSGDVGHGRPGGGTAGCCQWWPWLA